MNEAKYPKRLIEVDLPIKRISEHARREKSIRHGHISTLHIWWARRPLAACRAVLCAALWPDPADPLCPQSFRDKAAALITAFAKKATTDKKLSAHCSPEVWRKWQTLARPENRIDSNNESHLNVLRYALLDFIADFANWDNSTQPDYLQTARALTQAAHEALGGLPGTRPLVVDPFAGGGSIPLEALRVGADAFASDLNPVAVLLNKVILEYIPKYGQRLADEVRKWGAWIKEQAEKELAEFYPKDPDGATPIAYLWARTIRCEGPGCGAEVPLIRSLWLAKKANRSVALQLVPNPEARRVDFKIMIKKGNHWVDQADPESVVENPKFDGTVQRGSATCPCCSYTTQVERVREQLRARHGGANDAQLLSVVTILVTEQGRSYRLPTDADLQAVSEARKELERRIKTHEGALSLVPEEPLPRQGTLGFRVQLYGMLKWGDMFTARQLLALTTLVRLATEVGSKLTDEGDRGLAQAALSLLAAAIGRQADYTTSLCSWHLTGEKMGHTFGRQAIPMIWDFAEVAPFAEGSGSFRGALNWVAMVAEVNAPLKGEGQSLQSPADRLWHVADEQAHAFVTDPPYYDAVPYADLSDFFYVWFKRILPDFANGRRLSPKDEECIVDETKGKDKAYFERSMRDAMTEGRRLLSSTGIGIIVFAHKSSSGWESQLQAMVDAGWIMTGSWPIDTEMGSRLRAMNSAALASSVHLVCRPRENPDGSLRNDAGDWREVLQKLPKRIHQWLPRMAAEGIVGADAIFACLGPALEIFSRYARVEKASGEQVTLKEYLEHVWAAVAKEALNMIFSGADTTSFEEDARLTAMWLWTLSTDANGKDENGNKVVKSTSYTLEYDAARKIAQGLGVHIEKLDHLVEIKGNKARLLPVAERTPYLFGQETAAPGSRKGGDKRRKRASNAQTSLFQAVEQGGSERDWQLEGVASAGKTALDKVHQCMLLFAGGRSEALKRFLVEEGIGRDARFWQLAQSLSALYPSHTDEKRWVDGVMARKKSLGV